MTQSSAPDLVTVPREVLEECKHWHEREDKALSKSGRGDGDYYYRRNQHREEIARIEAALPSSDPEGGARGERELRNALQECQRVLAMMIDPASIKSTSVIYAFAAATEAESKARTVLSGFAKSAPDTKAPHNSGERDPSVMPDFFGADTKSDGGESSNETRGGTGDDCSVGKRGAWPHHDGQVCAQRSNVENQNPDVTAGETAPNSAPNHQPHAVSQATSPELLALIERAKSHVMTPEEQYEQRRSFVRGMCPFNRDYASWCAEVDKLLPPLASPAKTGGAE